VTMTSQPQRAAAPEVSPSPTVAAKKTPFEAAAKVVLATQLATVRFRAISARALEAADAIPKEVNFATTTKFLRPSVASTQGGFYTKTTLVFQIGGKLPDSDSTPTPYAVIQATVEVRYNLKPEAPEFSKDDLEDYALCYCPFHVWGYWREFVQSSLARLDLPQITVPLFLIQQAPQMVQDRSE
jgi:hypothetical protein